MPRMTIGHKFAKEKEETLKQHAIMPPGGGNDQEKDDSSIDVGQVKHVKDDVVFPLHLIKSPFATKKYKINGTEGRITVAEDSGGPIVAAMLPWQSNHIWGMNLSYRDKFDICFTEKMNGCCVIIQGSGTSRPMFIHANFGVEPNLKEESDFMVAMKKVRESRTDAYDKLLPLILKELPSDERPHAIQRAFRPEYYMDAERFPGFKVATVCGFKYGDNWIFFYHIILENPKWKNEPTWATRVKSSGPPIFSVTGECWPNFDEYE
jgi:hypothetical protein